MERGQDFAGARQGEPNAGLRRHDRGRGGNGRTAASRMRGSGRFGSDSYVHAVGGGAPRIVGQVEEQFGAQGNYLIDFYHVCEYLSAAAEAIAPNAAARDGDAKGRAKDGASGECAAAARSPLRSPSRGRRPSSSAAMPSLFERSRNQLKYKDA